MSTTKLTTIIALIDLALLLFVSGLGVAWFRHLKPGLRWLVVYLWVVTLVEVIAKLYYFGWLVGSNLWLLHLYTLMEFILITTMYRLILPMNRLSGRILQGFGWVGAAGIVGYSALQISGSVGEPVTFFQLHSKVFVHAAIMAYAAWFLIRAVQSPSAFVHGFRGMLPINSALLLYFSGTFMIFLTLRFLVGSDLEQIIVLWLINAILSLALHLTCVIGLWAKDSRLN